MMDTGFVVLCLQVTGSQIPADFFGGILTEAEKMFLERRTFGRLKLVFASRVSALAESLRKFDEAFILVRICWKLWRRR